MRTTDDMIDDIGRAEAAIRKYVGYYDAHEDECPSDFKMLMLMNGWHSPFEALYGLLKVISDNEMILRRRKVRIRPVRTKMERLIRNKGANV